MDAAALLLLADSRLPAGGHAHSGGLEAAAASGRVHDIPTLEGFLRGRLATTGLVAAAFAAASCAHPTAWAELDAEYDVRVPVPALRAVSRAQGRALLRVARRSWPELVLPDVHHAVALGATARVAGLSPEQAALAAAYEAVASPASAAIRLLALDPLAVNAALTRLAPEIDATAAAAVSYCDRPWNELPATSAPVLDLLGQLHPESEVRLFES
jgi:urease accessory protein